MMTTQKKGKLNFTKTFIISVVLLIVALIVSIVIGDAKIQISSIFDAIFYYDSKIQQHNIISEIRIPRDIGAMLVGVALATSGAVIQSVTKNGLADPSLIGLNSGASFMLALTFAFYPTAPFIVLMIEGFIGAIM